jgi:hypothetical protein
MKCACSECKNEAIGAEICMLIVVPLDATTTLIEIKICGKQKPTRKKERIEK